MSEEDVSLFDDIGSGSVRCISYGPDVRMMLAIVEKTGAINLNDYSDVQIYVYVIAAVSMFLFSCKDTRNRFGEE
jgi:hypothetical protein